jgi:hypothetical protein
MFFKTKFIFSFGMLGRISTIIEIIVNCIPSLRRRNWNFSYFTYNGFRVDCKDFNNEDLR